MTNATKNTIYWLKQVDADFKRAFGKRLGRCQHEAGYASLALSCGSSLEIMKIDKTWEWWYESVYQTDESRGKKRYKKEAIAEAYYDAQQMMITQLREDKHSLGQQCYSEKYPNALYWHEILLFFSNVPSDLLEPEFEQLLQEFLQEKDPETVL